VTKYSRWSLETPYPIIYHIHLSNQKKINQTSKKKSKTKDNNLKIVHIKRLIFLFLHKKRDNSQKQHKFKKVPQDGTRFFQVSQSKHSLSLHCSIHSSNSPPSETCDGTSDPQISHLLYKYYQDHNNRQNSDL